MIPHRQAGRLQIIAPRRRGDVVQGDPSRLHNLHRRPGQPAHWPSPQTCVWIVQHRYHRSAGIHAYLLRELQGCPRFHQLDGGCPTQVHPWEPRRLRRCHSSHLHKINSRRWGV